MPKNQKTKNNRNDHKQPLRKALKKLRFKLVDASNATRIGAAILLFTGAGILAFAAPEPNNASAFIEKRAETLRNEGICPDGYLESYSFSGKFYGCVVDPKSEAPLVELPRPEFDSGASVGPTYASQPLIEPRCYGTGTDGHRVQIIYGYTDEQYTVTDDNIDGHYKVHAVTAGDYSDDPYYIDLVRQSAIKMNTHLARSSLEKKNSTDEADALSINFVTNHGEQGCELDIQTVELPFDIENEGPSYTNFGDVIETLEEEGFDRNDRRYIVFFHGDYFEPVEVDGGIIWEVSTVFGKARNSNVSITGNLDDPTITEDDETNGFTEANRNEGYAIVFRDGWHNDDESWPITSTGIENYHRTALHEFFHTLGVVSEKVDNRHVNSNMQETAHFPPDDADSDSDNDIMQYGRSVNPDHYKVPMVIDENSEVYFNVDRDPFSNGMWNTAQSYFFHSEDYDGPNVTWLEQPKSTYIMNNEDPNAVIDIEVRVTAAGPYKSDAIERVELRADGSIMRMEDEQDDCLTLQDCPDEQDDGPGVKNDGFAQIRNISSDDEPVYTHEFRFTLSGEDLLLNKRGEIDFEVRAYSETGKVGTIVQKVTILNDVGDLRAEHGLVTLVGSNPAKYSSACGGPYIDSECALKGDKDGFAGDALLTSPRSMSLDHQNNQLF